jgi:ATP-dependent 26S proteasome regulatory subunit
MEALDMTTLTIMRMLPREVDPMVFNMSLEDPGQVSFSGIGGLSDQIRELREVVSKRKCKLMFVGDRTAVEESRIVHSRWN